MLSDDVRREVWALACALFPDKVIIDDSPCPPFNPVCENTLINYL